jgi:hypothetical protein
MKITKFENGDIGKYDLEGFMHIYRKSINAGYFDLLNNLRAIEARSLKNSNVLYKTIAGREGIIIYNK